MMRRGAALLVVFALSCAHVQAAVIQFDRNAPPPVGAPTPAEILGLIEKLNTKHFGFRPVRTGEMVKTAAGGGLYKIHLAVSDVICVKRIVFNDFVCQYQYVSHVDPPDGLQITSFLLNLNETSRPAFNFIKKGNGWTAPRLDASLGQEAAQAATQAAAPSRPYQPREPVCKMVHTPAFPGIGNPLGEDREVCN